MTNLFTLSPCLALCPRHVPFLFPHFHGQEKPLKLQNVLNLSQSKEKCDIDRTVLLVNESRFVFAPLQLEHSLCIGVPLMCLLFDLFQGIED